MRCLTILGKSFRQGIFREILEGEMVIRTLSSPLLQILCESILNLEVIVINIIAVDENVQVKTLKHE